MLSSCTRAVQLEAHEGSVCSLPGSCPGISPPILFAVAARIPFPVLGSSSRGWGSTVERGQARLSAARAERDLCELHAWKKREPGCPCCRWAGCLCNAQGRGLRVLHAWIRGAVLAQTSVQGVKTLDFCLVLCVAPGCQEAGPCLRP